MEPKNTKRTFDSVYQWVGKGKWTRCYFVTRVLEMQHHQGSTEEITLFIIEYLNIIL